MTQPVSLSPDILVVRFSAIGDILLTTPLLRALRARHPGARITMLTKRRFVPLVSDNPNVDEVFGLDETPDGLDGLLGTAARLRGIRYTHRLDLHGSLRSLALRALAPGAWASYSKRRVARTLLIRTKRNFYHGHVPVAERYFEAAADLDVRPDDGPPEFFLSAEAEARAAAWLAQAGFDPEQRPLVAMAPGAAHATKRWPVKSWAALACRIAATGADVVLLGGPDDAPLAAEVKAQAGAGPHIASAAGALSLQGTGAVIKRARALISGDTGVMHMATGVGTPVVALFGPTVREFGFAPYNARAAVVEQNLPCRPCSAQGGPACPLGHHRCLTEIAPEIVYTALCKIVL